MSKPPAFKGQTARSKFTLEQIEAIASPARSEVFWAFHVDEPKSAADIAADLGKSAATVHYHVNELARVGLLVAVGTRKKRSRTETLYVIASRSLSTGWTTAPKDFRKHAQAGFAALARAMVRESAELSEALENGVEFATYRVYNRTSVRLTPEDAAKLRQRLLDVIDSAEDSEGDGERVRVNTLVYMSPTIAESKKWRKGKR